ncbi:MAG: uroporphyrinogen-III synthase [Acidobacteriota bacterium]|nr:uroporphyrinogen-III synthase [Acidobacteriota bacterium]
MPTEILVIRGKDRFSSILIEQGFLLINLPLIKTEPLEDLSELEGYLAQIETFDGIFITSARAAEIVLAKLSEMQKTFRGKFFVLGKKSVDLLQKSGYKTFFSEDATTAKELLQSIPEKELKNKKLLFPRGNRSLRTIPETLENFAAVVETIVYQTTETETSDEKFNEIKVKFERGKIAAVCFFSPSGAEAFLEKFENFSQKKIKIAVIGKTTAHFVEAENLRVDFIAEKPKADDFALDLAKYLRKEI